MTIGKKCYSSTAKNQGDAAEFTRTEVEQRIAVVYKAGFHAGAKWAKEGCNNERTPRPQRHDRAAEKTPV